MGRRDFPPVRRARGGRYVATLCNDPNCNGKLVSDGNGDWHCDGLTHETDEGPLIACTRWIEGPLQP